MNNNLLYTVEDKPPFGLSLLLAAQHLLAALGGIIAVPLVIGNVLKLPTEDTITLVNAALLISGVVTVIQCKGLGPIGIRLPSVMGTSFTFVAAALAIGFSEYGIAGILVFSHWFFGDDYRQFLHAVYSQIIPTTCDGNCRYDDRLKPHSCCR